MQRKIFSAVFVMEFCLLPALLGQSPSIPKPAPELKKLNYFAGAWKSDAEMKASQFGPGGKFSGTDQIEWMEGNFFLLIHNKYSGSMGSGVELAVMGYDPLRKVYTFTSFNSSGEYESATGRLEGDTWTWQLDQIAPGTSMKGRYIQKILSPTSYTMKFEVAPDGSNWSTVMEGKATKQ